MMDPALHVLEAVIKVFWFLDASKNKIFKSIDKATANDADTPQDDANKPPAKKMNIIKASVNSMALALSIAYLSLVSAQEAMGGHEVMITGALGGVAAIPVVNIALEGLLLGQALYESKKLFEKDVSDRSKGVNVFNILVSALAVAVAISLMVAALAGPQAVITVGVLFALFAVRTALNMYDKYQQRIEDQKKAALENPKGEERSGGSFQSGLDLSIKKGNILNPKKESLHSQIKSESRGSSIGNNGSISSTIFDTNKPLIERRNSESNFSLVEKNPPKRTKSCSI